jgi:hypothetical protein
MQVGDLVRHTAGKQLGSGLVMQVGESDRVGGQVVTVLWSSSNSLRYCSRPYLEVLSESR